MNLEFNIDLSNKIYNSTLEFINNKIINLNIWIKYKKIVSDVRKFHFE